jgi:hypothetical protein
MQLQTSWKPVIVSDAHRAGDGKVGKTATVDDENSRVNFRFTVAASLALGLPALIGAGLYLAAAAVLRLS